MIRLANTHPAVVAFRRTHNVAHGVHMRHVCALGTCTFARLQGTHYFFCSSSLHAHVCADTGCTLAKEHDGSGLFTCPLTGIEMKCRDYSQQTTIKVVGHGGARFLQAGANLSSKVAHSKRFKKKANVTKAAVTKVLNAMVVLQHQCQNITDTVAIKILKRQTSFVAVISQLAVHCALFQPSLPPPPGLTKSILRYASKVYDRLSPLPTPTVFIAVCLSLLQVGFEARGVVIFPCIPWVAQTAPTLTGYARLKNIQCRAMSICTRALKKLVFSSGGICDSCIFDALSTGR